MKKRISGEGVVYYNPYAPIKQGAVTRDKDAHDDAGYFDSKSGWWSDGNYMALTGTLPKWQGKRVLNPRDMRKSFKDILASAKSKSNPAKICGLLHVGDNDDPPMVHVFDSTFNSLFYNVLYIDHILTLYPKAQAFVCGSSMLVFRYKNKVIGLVMPRAIDPMNDYFWMRFKRINPKLNVIEMAKDICERANGN